MSYEFSDRSQKLNLPNPYRIENIFLYISGAILFLTGIIILFSVREHLQSDSLDVGLVGALFVAVTSLLTGAAWIWRGASQLNYYVGRGLPRGLAPEIPEGQDGITELGQEVREMLRNGAVSFQDPGHNPLYRFIPNLIFSPQIVRGAANRLAQNGVALAAYIISMAFSLLVLPNAHTANWLGLFYLALGYLVIFQPMIKGNLNAQSNTLNEAKLSIGLLVSLVVVAIIGPVFLALFKSFLPVLPMLHINVALFLTAIASFIATILGLATLSTQMGPPPQAVGSAQKTEVFTMNAHPAKLMEQVDRMLMEQWKEGIPNRRYLRQSPVIKARQGEFRLELVEETQPMPRERVIPEGLAHAFALPQYRWLALLSVWFAMLMSGVAFASFELAHDFMKGENFSASLTFVIGLGIAAVYAMRSAHALWGRYDFRSSVIWIQVQGSYESAHMEMGRILSDSLKSEKDIINIEAMTLRVWATEVDTVLFDRTGPRQVLAMRGMVDYADHMAQELRSFGLERTTLVTPQSSIDMQRADQIGQMNSMFRNSNAHTLPLPADKSKISETRKTQISGNVKTEAKPISQIKAVFCHKCGQQAERDDHFCGSCGARLVV